MTFRSRWPSWRLGLAATAVAATFAVSGLLTSATATPAPVTVPSAAALAQGGFADLIEAVKPAVVNISVRAAVTQARLNGPGPQPFGPGSPFEDFFRRFGQPMPHGGQPHGQQMVLEAEAGDRGRPAPPDQVPQAEDLRPSRARFCLLFREPGQIHSLTRSSPGSWCPAAGSRG